jgi:hypothetical protein
MCWWLCWWLCWCVNLLVCWCVDVLGGVDGTSFCASGDFWVNRVLQDEQCLQFYSLHRVERVSTDLLQRFMTSQRRPFWGKNFWLFFLRRLSEINVNHSLIMKKIGWKVEFLQYKQNDEISRIDKNSENSQAKKRKFPFLEHLDPHPSPVVPHSRSSSLTPCPNSPILIWRWIALSRSVLGPLLPCPFWIPFLAKVAAV